MFIAIAALKYLILITFVPFQCLSPSEIGHVGKIARLVSAITPKARGCRAGSGRIFPFRFRRQSIRFPRLLAEPLHVAPRILIPHAEDSMLNGLLESRVPPVPFLVEN